ncbi:MAG: hypothetical protein NVS9B3_14260 [Gemmatimonadaceae bacterium]
MSGSGSKPGKGRPNPQPRHGARRPHGRPHTDLLRQRSQLQMSNPGPGDVEKAVVDYILP